MLNESGSGCGSGNSSTKPGDFHQEFISKIRQMTDEGVYKFSHPRYGDLRVANLEQLIWFSLNDLGDMLGLTKPANSLKHLLETYKEINKLPEVSHSLFPLQDRRGVTQNSVIVTEDVGYDLIIQSRKKIGIEIRHWLSHEVVPAIRKHGVYAPEELAEEFLKNPDALLLSLQALQDEREKTKQLNQELEEAKPKIMFTDKCLKSEDTIGVREFAKLLSDKDFNIGNVRLYKVLRESKCIVKDSTEPTQYAMNNGWLVREQFYYETNAGDIKLNHATRITPKGQVYLVHKLMNEPRYRKYRPTVN